MLISSVMSSIVHLYSGSKSSKIFAAVTSLPSNDKVGVIEMLGPTISTLILLLLTLIGIPVAIGGVVGGLGVWWLEDMVANEIKQRSWVLPLFGALAGAGIGFMIKDP